MEHKGNSRKISTLRRIMQKFKSRIQSHNMDSQWKVGAVERFLYNFTIHWLVLENVGLKIY